MVLCVMGTAIGQVLLCCLRTLHQVYNVDIIFRDKFYFSIKGHTIKTVLQLLHDTNMIFQYIFNIGDISQRSKIFILCYQLIFSPKLSFATESTPNPETLPSNQLVSLPKPPTTITSIETGSGIIPMNPKNL